MTLYYYCKCPVIGVSCGFLIISVHYVKSVLAALAGPLSSVVINHWRWVKVLHISLPYSHHHIRRPEFSGSPFYFLLIWICEFERESLIASLSWIKDSERTLSASEDSNLEVKKKSPCRSDRLIAAAGLSRGSQHPLVSSAVRPPWWSSPKGDVSPLE